MYLNKLSFEYCHKCGFQLKKAKKLPVARSLLKAYQRTKTIQNILTNGYQPLLNKPIYSFQIFEVLLQIIRVCIYFKKYKDIEYHKVVEDLAKINHESNRPPIIQISIKQQFLLISALLKLFEDYPHNVIKFVSSNKLSHWNLTKDMNLIPYWYEKLLDKIAPKPSFTSTLLTPEEVISAIKWLKTQKIEINKANIRQLFQCDFYHNSLGKKIFHVT